MEIEKITEIEINGVPYRIDGDSAYEVAVSEGFKGTKQEWLDSLALEATQKAEGYADSANLAREDAENERIKAEQASKEAEEHTISHVHKWLDAHPEETTTVQDGALTDAKFTDELKIKTIKDYVTPEMFGAVGDGKTDDTDAIQTAIDKNRPVRLVGTYRINRPLEIFKDNQTLLIDGKLLVHGDVGIVVMGSYNIIGGDGTIEVWKNRDAGIATAIKLFINSGAVQYGNKVTVKRIRNNYKKNDNIGIEIVGGEKATGACYDRIETYFEWFRYGVISHSADGQNADSWYTALTIDCTFNQCVQTVTFDWWGDGSSIHGQIQPIGKNDVGLPTDFDVNNPVVRLSNGCLFDAFVWDTTLMASKYAIEVTGRNCVINSYLPDTLMKIPLDLKVYTTIKEYHQKKEIAVATENHRGSTSVGVFDNTNDLLLHCHYNPSMSAKYSYDGVNFEKIRGGYGEDVLFNGNNKSFAPRTGETKMVLLFEFTEPKAIRHIAIWGNRLADYYSFEVALNGTETEFVQLGGTQTADIDYIRDKSAETRCALWSYDYDRDNGILGTMAERKVKALKITMGFTDGKKYSMSRISAFDVEPHIMSNTGGRFTGDVYFAPEKGVVLQSANGSKFRLSVNDDGTVATEAL